jgi:serine/threonine-protein kinase RIO1
MRPRPSPWHKPTPSGNTESRHCDRKSLRSIIEQQRQEKQHRQDDDEASLVVVQLAQEEEMLRLAMERSLQDLSFSSHDTSDDALLLMGDHHGNSMDDKGAGGSYTPPSSLLGGPYEDNDDSYSKDELVLDLSASSSSHLYFDRDPEAMTTEEIRQIQASMEESERNMTPATRRHFLGRNDSPSSLLAGRASTSPLLLQHLPQAPPLSPQSVKPAVAATAEVASSSCVNNEQPCLDASVDWKTAASHLTSQELAQIQHALEEAGSESSDNVTGVQYDGDVTEEERLAVERAIEQADAAAEAQSLLVALQLQQQEETTAAASTQFRQRKQQHQGNVRVLTRADLALERAGSVGAFYDSGPKLRHPLEEGEGGDDCEGQGDAGFRMNASTPQAWARRDAHTVIGPNAEVRTKHDAHLSGQSNAHRLALEADEGTGKYAMVGTKAFNSFHHSIKRNTRKGVAAHGTGRAGSDADGTKGGAMDARVREQLTRAVNSGLIQKMNGAVKEGKEALVYHADGGVECDGLDVAVKVFKRIQEFRGRGDYVDGDPRYARANFRKVSVREQLELWAEKEFRNLVRANRSGVPVATPLRYKENILFMTFLGEGGWPAPQLREIDLRKGSKRWTTLYNQVMESIRLLYQQARLVHGDLSEYNILVAPAGFVKNRLVADVQEMQAVLIDFGQAVDVRHPESEALLERDIDRVQSFFRRQGIVTMSSPESFDFIVLPPDDADHTVEEGW